jgi:hypothetical protein
MQYPKFPETCPSCNRTFSTLRRPKSQLNKRGKALFLISVFVLIAWGTLLFVLFASLRMIIIPKHPAAWAVLGAIIFGPSIVIGKFAMNQRSVTLKCRECRWSQTYAMEKYRKVR